MFDYIHELNEGQRAAVLYNEGPSLVIAGAGSGKTRVLTYKIAYLLENGYQPWNIMALTFTNKAAREMKERIAQLVGVKRARYLWMGTFHSIFLRILRIEAQSLHFTPNFTIYDATDSKSLIRALCKEMKLDEKIYKPGVVQARISRAKNYLLSPDSYACSKDAYKSDCAAGIPLVRDIYRLYQVRCRMADAMDFDDLLFYTHLLFKNHPEFLARYRAQFQYILVDEYQDTNVAQHSIVLQLSQVHRHVCVVGDDAQSIYSFRGANIDNILGFTKNYPETRIFKLEQNYRSTRTIVSAANSLIAKNRWQIQKQVFSKKEQGNLIELFQAYSDVEEAEIVAGKIAEVCRETLCAYSDFAVLYRTNAQSRVFEESLRKRGMPYRIYGGLSFYQRKEIKDVIAYFRLAVNPHDEEAFKRIINYPPRGIGDTTVGKIIAAATHHGVSLWSVLGDPVSYGLEFNKGILGRLQAFHQLICLFIEETGKRDASEMGILIIRQSGIFQEVSQDNLLESQTRKENLEELLNGMSDFCMRRQEEGNSAIALNDFLSEVSLLTDQDSEEGDEAKITLMTIHASKGLEFRNVFVVGLEENLFPGSMAGESPREMEEERRLFYVAITRAMEHCFFSYSKSRFRYGKMEFSTPSRFLKEIDPHCLRLPQHSAFTRNAKEGSFYKRPEEKPLFVRFPSADSPSSSRLKRLSSLVNAPAATSLPQNGELLRPGQHIVHERFGIGEVLKVEGEGENAKATIRFQHVGDKQLLLRFARYQLVESDTTS